MDRTDASLIALRRILRATELYARELAYSARLTPAQLRVLQIVDEKGSVTPKELAKQMGVSQATITALVDKLVSRGQVQRKPSETDRRQTNVTITQDGHQTLVNAPDALQQKYVREFEAMDSWEQAMLVAALERVASMLDAQSIDAAPVLTTGELHIGRKRHEV
ncbi:MarR family winged helix-turn-helix transcriptional regulator [Lacimonas salitolerans]|uniref:MarR family winged helix-turn-helix transcriptional regulator n=1 Tax=Lacimonas salitolerans TaxID=1323750 RepID=A0ABW4ED72_9RHOB